MSRYDRQLRRLTRKQRETLAFRLRNSGSDSAESSKALALAAYVRLKSGSSVSMEEIRQYLTARLPAHMVPRHIACVANFPLMANGKVDRVLLSQRSTAQPRIAPIQVARTELEKCFVGIWKEVLQLDEVGIRDNFFELGGDSILAIQIVSRTIQKGYALTPRLLFQNPSIVELVKQMDSDTTSSGDHAVATAGNYEIVEGEIPLSPIQNWFFERDIPEKNHFNQAFFFTLPEAMGSEYLKHSLQALLMHHDALRLRFFPVEDTWVQFNAGTDTLEADNLPLVVYDYSAMTLQEQEKQILSCTRKIQKSLDISRGTMMYVAYFDLGELQAARLLMVVHHLAMDGISWRILLEDFQLAYQQTRAGEQICLPAKSTSYKQWAKDICSLLASGRLDDEVDYWTGLPYDKAVELPVDFRIDANRELDVETVSTVLDVETTLCLLQKVPVAYNTQINEILMTALALAFYRWKKLAAVLVELEHHGRELGAENADLSRSVGWFTVAYPVVLQTDFKNDLASSITSTKEHLRSIPNKGAGYWLLRHGSSDKTLKSRMKHIPQAQINFNYLGQLDLPVVDKPVLEFAAQIPEHSYSPSTPRPYLLEINSYIKGRQLTTTWRYNKNIHRRTSMESLSMHYEAALQDIISHCVAPGSGVQTPSDFPGIQLDQDDLDEFLNNMD